MENVRPILYPVEVVVDRTLLVLSCFIITCFIDCAHSACQRRIIHQKIVFAKECREKEEGEQECVRSSDLLARPKSKGSKKKGLERQRKIISCYIVVSMESSQSYKGVFMRPLELPANCGWWPPLLSGWWTIVTSLRSIWLRHGHRWHLLMLTLLLLLLQGHGHGTRWWPPSIWTL